MLGEAMVLILLYYCHPRPVNGFYFCEIMHEVRRIDVLSKVRNRFELIDSASTPTGLSGRDQWAILKVAGALLKHSRAVDPRGSVVGNPGGFLTHWVGSQKTLVHIAQSAMANIHVPGMWFH